MRIFDITLPLSPDIPTWPGTSSLRLQWSKRLDAGDECNNSHLECDSHSGTHVDAPSHFFEDGATVEQLPLDILIGPVTVVHLPEVTVVTAALLENLALPPSTERLLVRTRNSEIWAGGSSDFNKDYVAFSADGAQWIVSQGFRLLGVDYLSVGTFQDRVLTHRILLGAGVVVLEGLNLFGVEPGSYELICLPLKLAGAEGAPARALLIKNEGERGSNKP